MQNFGYLKRIGVFDEKDYLSENAMLWLPMNEASGNRVATIGTYTAIDNNTVGSATGLNYALAADFERSNSEYLSINSNDFNFANSDFTIHVRFKLESLSSGNYPLVNWTESNSNDRSYDLFANYNPDVIRWSCSSNGISVIQLESTSTISTGVWHYVTAYYNSVTEKLGLKLNSDAWETEILLTGGPFSTMVPDLLIGKQNQATIKYYDGLIGSIGIWQEVLPAEEVDRLHAGWIPS